MLANSTFMVVGMVLENWGISGDSLLLANSGIVFHVIHHKKLVKFNIPIFNNHRIVEK